MIKAFLFDLDGTLVDTHRANFEAYKRALQDFGVTMTWEEFKPSIGKQAKVFLPELAPALSDDKYEEIKKRKGEYYRDLLHLTRANEPIINFMKSVSQYYPCALVTTAQPANATAILRHHELIGCFKEILTAVDVEYHKPHPDVYIEVLRRLRVMPNEAITFEDSESGRQSAEAAGIPVIMVKDFVV